MYPLLVGREKGFGGAELDLWVLGRRLAADPDYRVTVLTQTIDSNPPKSADGMQVRTMRPRPGGIGSSVLRKAADINYLRRVFFELLRLNPDVYLTEVASIQALLTLMAARVRGKPFVFRFGSDMETSVETMADFCFHGSRGLAQRFVRLLPKAAAVIAQTQNQADLLKANFGVQAQVIRNAHEMPTDVPGLEHRSGVLWIGRADPVKQPGLLIEIAQRLPDQHFTFVLAPSKGYEQLSSDLEASVRTLPNVQFIPGLPQNETTAIFESARVMIMTSKAEGLPNVMIEALKHGCPMVTLNTNPDRILAEFSDGSDIPPAAGYCSRGSIENMLEVTSRLCSDEAFWNSSSRLAVQAARENFDINVIMAQYNQLLGSLSGHD